MEIMTYNKEKLGWNYTNDKRLVIKYTLFNMTWYRLHSQSTKDNYTFQKPTKIENRRVEKVMELGKKEFKEEYNNNKWLVPINYKLDLNLP